MNKIEKLELKHLCGYFPHRLNGIVANDGIIRKIVGWNYSSLNLHPSKFKYTHCSFDDFKPILIPLSALTEQLPDGSIPIEEMYELFGSKSGFGKLFYQSDLLESLKRGINEVKHKHVEYLISKHFDIYGLIEFGLAIDKRTI